MKFSEAIKYNLPIRTDRAFYWATEVITPGWISPEYFKIRRRVHPYDLDYLETLDWEVQIPTIKHILKYFQPEGLK